MLDQSVIRIFIGSSPVYAEQEKVLEYSIRKHTSAEVEITFMRGGEKGLVASGCTGFTNFRWAVPDLAGHKGYAIYLDCDMLILADIKELWVWRHIGRWVCLKDGRTEVSVIDCRRKVAPANQVHKYNKHAFTGMVHLLRDIPPCWNVKSGKLEPGMKLLHFTDLHSQPWLGFEHKNPEALKILRQYEEDALIDMTYLAMTGI